MATQSGQSLCHSLSSDFQEDETAFCVVLPPPHCTDHKCQPLAMDTGGGSIQARACDWQDPPESAHFLLWPQVGPA